MATADSTPQREPPRAVALHHLRLALASGVRGSLREAIQQALDVAEDDGRSDLTDISYRNLATGKTKVDPRRPGFRMRTNKSGRVWIYRYDHPTTHRQVELRLGTYPDTTLAAARSLWEEARRRRLNGEDPSELPDGPNANLPTVRKLCDRYIRDYARKVKRTALEDEKLLERELLPTYGDVRVDQLPPEAISAVVFGIKDRGSPRQAEKARACFSTLFRVALGKSRKIDYPDGPWLPRGFANPMEHVPQLAEREVVSTDLKVSELKAFLINLDACGMHPTMARAFRFQLQTCARVSEVLNMTWDEVDWEEGVWKLPQERSKNKITHRVMLSRQSLDLLGEPRPMQSLSPWVFPSIHDPRKPLRKDASLEAMRRHREALGMPPGAASHALRHTCITQLASMGCPRDTRDRISNHKPPKTDQDARYNKHEYDGEAREWWQRWADRLTALEIDNVVALDREARS